MVWPHSEGKIFSVPSGAVCCQCLPFCGHAWHNGKRRYSLPKGFCFSATLWRCGVCTALAHLLCFLGLCADGPAPWPALGNGCGLGAKNSRARFTQAGQIGAVRRGYCHCRIWGICVLEKRHWLLFVFVFFLCVF